MVEAARRMCRCRSFPASTAASRSSPSSPARISTAPASTSSCCRAAAPTSSTSASARAIWSRLVDQYNQTYAGKKGPNPAQTFPRVTLPSSYETGRHVSTRRIVRVTKIFRYQGARRVAGVRRGLQPVQHANLSGYETICWPPDSGSRPPLQQHLRHRRPAIVPVGHAAVVLGRGCASPIRAATVRERLLFSFL